MSNDNDEGSSSFTTTPFRRAESITITLHGSCASCHHWFNRSLITITPQASNAQIVCCTNCRKRFFGLGGNSTHTSFNSQSTIAQGPGKFASLTSPPSRRLHAISSFESVNRAASPGIISSDESGLKLARPGHPLREVSTFPGKSSPHINKGKARELVDEEDRQVFSKKSKGFGLVVQSAKKRVRKTLKHFERRTGYRFRLPVEALPKSPKRNEEHDGHLSPVLGNPEARETCQETGPAQSSRAWNRSSDEYLQESDGSQEGQQSPSSPTRSSAPEPDVGEGSSNQRLGQTTASTEREHAHIRRMKMECPCRRACRCGVDCGCVASSTRARRQSSTSLARVNEFLLETDTSANVRGRSNISILRSASPSFLIRIGAWIPRSGQDLGSANARGVMDDSNLSDSPIQENGTPRHGTI